MAVTSDSAESLTMRPLIGNPKLANKSYSTTDGTKFIFVFIF